MQVTEVSIAQLRAALETGQTTAVELVQAYLARIDAYNGPQTATALNAVVVRNPEALKEAEASDSRRARGETLGPLDGIPYTAKDSYLVKGLTAASGSPAFANLVAQRDAFTIERLRAGLSHTTDFVARPRWPLDDRAPALLGSGKKGAKA